MKPIKLTAAIALLVIGSSCASKTVNDVMADPHRYAERNIALRGRVVEIYSVAGTGFYRLEDTTGRSGFSLPKACPEKAHAWKSKERSMMASI